jgi:Fe-S cluster assembly protein SufD
MDRLMQKTLPDNKDEKWRKTKLKDFKTQYFHPSIGKIISQTQQEEVCLLPELDSINISIINGYYQAETEWNVHQNGIITGNLLTALNKYPELTDGYFNRLTAKHNKTFLDLNMSVFQGGLFLYIPENVIVNIQISQKLDAKIDALINTRNLIIAGKNSQVNIIQCDDSNVHRSHFATFISEVFVEKNAQVNWYKFQNINNNSALISDAYFYLEENAKLYTNYFELNGKLLRNEQFVDIAGTNAQADLLGLYLTDKTQQSDNVILISHTSEGSYSNQQFKGIIDDSGKAYFNGQILVKKDAQKTQAYQKNDNILLTDKARVSSQPFLEIYADDVSCSHGSTTGQIDEEALFYIRQRGIALRDAQLLQLYAFAGEIIDTIKIPELLEPAKDLIKKRLNGELDACEDCILQCADKTK